MTTAVVWMEVTIDDFDEMMIELYVDVQTPSLDCVNRYAPAPDLPLSCCSSVVAGLALELDSSGLKFDWFDRSIAVGDLVLD